MKVILQSSINVIAIIALLIISFFFLGSYSNSIILNDSPPTFFQPTDWCSNFPAVPGAGSIYGHASCVLGDTLYVAGGSQNGEASIDFNKYTIHGNEWRPTSSLPGPKAGGDLVAAGGRIYYIGGGNITYTSGTSEQYVYNPSTGAWSTIANIPIPVTGNVAESYQDSLIYCISGGWDTYITTIQVYRILSNTWTTATSLPSGKGRRSFAGGLEGNRIFVACGYSNSFRNDFVIGTINPSNPMQINWTSGPHLAINSSRPGGTAIGGRFYVVLGETTVNQNGNDSMAIWDTTAASWSYVDGKPFRGSNYWGVVSACFVYCQGKPGVKIWVPGGALGTSSTRPLDVFSDTCLSGCLVGLTGISSNGNNIPSEFSLLQNYPNPFNPSTTISYLLPAASNVSLRVYDVSGRQVTVLVNEYKPAGKYSVKFDETNKLASGVYFYTIEASPAGIQTGKFRDTKKMLLVK
jgi:hypothetical protein